MRAQITVSVGRRRRFCVSQETATEIIDWLAEIQKKEQFRKIPSPAEVLAASTGGPGNGFTRAALASLGISWPPKKSWRKRLEAEWRRQQAKAEREQAE